MNLWIILSVTLSLSLTHTHDIRKCRLKNTSCRFDHQQVDVCLTDDNEDEDDDNGEREQMCGRHVLFDEAGHPKRIWIEDENASRTHTHTHTHTHADKSHFLQPSVQHSPSHQHKLAHQPLPPHGHQDASHRHALAEAGHHPGFGQVASQLLQQPVEAAFTCVAVYLVRVGDADPFLCRHVFKRLHPTLTIITCRGGKKTHTDLLKLTILSVYK